MLPLRKNITISPTDVSQLIQTHYASLMQSFYELESNFLSGIYKRYGSIETANIVLCFARNVHLEIIRQREKDLNFNVSLEKFWKNYNFIDKPCEKITSVVKITGIPKETVRRKIKNLMNVNFLKKDKLNKKYSWNISEKDLDDYFKIVNKETKSLAIFISKVLKDLPFISKNLQTKDCCCLIEEEIHSQFSFYWYHFLTCQLEWLKWWQTKLKDNDLLLIALQVTIPTLKYIDRKEKEIKLDDIHKIVGQVNTDDCVNCAINATSVSDITGIPRATVIRKLDKLVNLGFLIREKKTKRYSVNQSYESRTRNIMSKDNVSFTIQNFSEYIAIILNSLVQNKLKITN